MEACGSSGSGAGEPREAEPARRLVRTVRPLLGLAIGLAAGPAIGFAQELLLTRPCQVQCGGRVHGSVLLVAPILGIRTGSCGAPVGSTGSRRGSVRLVEAAGWLPGPRPGSPSVPAGRADAE